MPVIHPYSGGAKGTSHGNDYYIADPEAACVACAKLQLEMLSLLLSDGAERAKKIVEEFEPQFESGRAYLDYIDSLNCTGDRIEYGENEVIIR